MAARRRRASVGECEFLHADAGELGGRAWMQEMKS